MPRANSYFLPGYVWHITHLNERSQFQTAQWFDGLTMSGFILNRFAPFKSFKRCASFKALPRFRFKNITNH